MQLVWHYFIGSVEILGDKNNVAVTLYGRDFFALLNNSYHVPHRLKALIEYFSMRNVINPPLPLEWIN